MFERFLLAITSVAAPSIIGASTPFSSRPQVYRVKKYSSVYIDVVYGVRAHIEQSQGSCQRSTTSATGRRLFAVYEYKLNDTDMTQDIEDCATRQIRLHMIADNT